MTTKPPGNSVLNQRHVPLNTTPPPQVHVPRVAPTPAPPPPKTK